MIIYIMLFILGQAVSVPAIYWWLFGIGLTLRILKFGFDMYKLGGN